VVGILTHSTKKYVKRGKYFLSIAKEIIQLEKQWKGS